MSDCLVCGTAHYNACPALWGGQPEYPVDVTNMIYPVECKWCGNVHDAGKVKVIDRHSDCSTWQCPGCKTRIDDRPESWGGSAIRVGRAR